MAEKEKFVEIGKIVAPHGVRGEVRVISLSEFDEAVETAKEFFVTGLGWIKAEGLRYHKKFILLKFAGIDQIEQAESLRNKIVYLTRQQIGELPEGRYYIEDLIGLEVYDLAGAFLGTLAEVLVTGSNDVYIIRKAGQKDLLLPALKEVIQNIDLPEKKMLVAPPVWEGE